MRYSWIRFLTLGSLLLLILASIYLARFKNQVQAPVENEQQVEKAQLKIGQKTISVEIVRTREQIRQGLSGRESLGSNSGMYFDFGRETTATFWMKDMKFPIDIIWIKNGVVVGVEKNAPIPTSTSVATFTSPGKITHVLEVNAGFFDQHNLQLGDSVTFL